MSAKQLSVPISMITIAAALGVISLWHRQEIVAWIAGAGWEGVIVFAGIYVIATLLLIPPGILNALSGALFGVLLGMAVALPANIAAALIGFAVSRTIGGAWAQAVIQRRRSWGAIDRAVGRAGFKIVFLLRCSPISPFAILNYALGLTRVRFRHYALGSVLGTVPGTLLYVCAGSTAASAAGLLAHRLQPGGAPERIFLWAGLAATVVGVALITRYAKSELRDETQAKYFESPANNV
jgi:uncharacterized membrane protein YdjX (TVP38/TMEM64 family)